MRKSAISLLAVLVAALLALTGAAGCAVAEPAAEEPFSLWEPDAPALKALVEYVEAVTDESSPDYIPPVDRIATFDMDGTLMAELAPTYLEVMLLTERILADPSYEPDEEMLEFGRMTRDHALDKSFPSDYDYEFSYHQARAFAGMTLPEYADFITRFLVHEADGFDGMTYADAYYLPMEEVVEYLQENGFKCYVVSGSDRFIVRAFIEGVFDIPPERAIGSDTALEARDQGDTDGIEYVFTGDDTLVRTDRLLIKDLKTNKVVQIAQEIGRQPVLSFGNSSGDVSMNNYALLNNRYRSAAFMVVADDDVRDYGKAENHDALTEKWQGMGYNVISMRDDWKTIYGDDVKKTGEFHWLSDYADEAEPVYTIDAIRKYGNLILSVSGSDLLARGFAYGDIVDVTINGQTYEMPVGKEYNDVDQGCMVCRAVIRPEEGEDYTALGINMGDLATDTGIATKETTEADPGYIWRYNDGVETPVEVTISMKEQGGYYDQWVQHQMERSNDRADYPDLTDAEFANFRAVEAPEIAAGRLYRSSSPINSDINRDAYAAAATEAAGIKTIVNLVDSDETMRGSEGFDGSYYSRQNVIALDLDMDFNADRFKAGLAEGLRFIASHEGPYLIHCLQGKDRSGFVAAILECLTGATEDEVVADYMATFYNFYGVEPGTEQYQTIANSNILKSLRAAFGLDTLEGADLRACAEEYLAGIGLSPDEISAVRASLS